MSTDKSQELRQAIEQLANSLYRFADRLTEKPTETKKKKVEKDPNAPKRNLSSYMLYTQAVRPKVVAEHPDMKAIEIAKFVGEMWNKLSEKEKMPYVKQAQKEKVRFEKENASYKDSLVSAESSTLNKRKEPEEEEEERKSKKVKKEKKSSDKKSKKNNF
ncbi:hypothetical protein G6F43_007470 [Rhizopus delemar]|nr:hypothetical protein G6F43_007470 [Rhizopus delemar]